MASYSGPQLVVINRALGYNKFVYNPSSNLLGFAGKGYKVNWAQSLNDGAVIANAVANMTTLAQTAATAAQAIAASRPKATSNSPVAIGTSGTRTFATVENITTSKPIFEGDNVKAYVTADSSKFVTGVVKSVSANSFTMEVASGAGSGTFSAWTIIVQGERGAATGIAKLQDDPNPILGGNLTTGDYVISVSFGGGISFAADSDGLAMNGAPITGARMVDYDEQVTNLGTVVNTVPLSSSSVKHFYCTLGGAAEFAVSGAPAAGGKIVMVLEIIQPPSTVNTSGAIYPITFSGPVEWIGATPVAPAYGKRLRVRLERRDGESAWLGQQEYTNVAAPA